MLVVDALVEKRLGNSPYPVTETFVPEAFVKRRVAKVELGLRSSEDDATPPLTVKLLETVKGTANVAVDVVTENLFASFVSRTKNAPA